MKISLSLIIVLFFFISCNSDKKIENQSAIITKNNSAEESKVKKEEFRKFIYEFTADSIFQKSRINFPLEKEKYKDNDFNETEVKMIDKKEWKYLTGFLSMNYNLQLYDNFECKLKDSDERVYAYEGVENGVDIRYYFKRIKGKWYLVKLEDFST